MDMELKYRVSKLLQLPDLIVGRIVVKAPADEILGMSSSRLFTCLLTRLLGQVSAHVSLPTTCPRRGTFRFTFIAACSLATFELFATLLSFAAFWS